VIEDVLARLPDIVWYLTADGRDMWARSPYGFFFTTKEAAAAFAQESGTALDLVPIGIASRELVSEQGLDAMRALKLTRLFLDPRIDAVTGDVYGTILRVETAS
jgi:hypothetical protein